MDPIDLVALAVLALAILRGVFLGLIREAFSIGALAAAIVIGRAWAVSAGVYLRDLTGVAVGDVGATLAGGFVVGLLAWIAVRIAGRLLQRGARAVGLGFLDRLGGAVLGGAEGVLILLVLFLLSNAVLGRDHPALADSQTVAIFQGLESDIRDEPAVASPPP